MNHRQTELWNNLMSLTEYNEEFFYADRTIRGRWFRIFNYRLCSYTAFLLPDALECRGHTFEITEEGNDATALRLVSWPFSKFFNLFENPFTMELDLSEVVEIADKADGSLISTYEIDGELFLKTKGSLDSDQAITAMGWLQLEENYNFHQELVAAERLNYNVLMEWCSSDNRIVIGYEEPELRVLGVRSLEDGSYINFKDIDIYIFPEIVKRWTNIIPANDAEEYINKVDTMVGVEGVVCRMADGLRFKKKGQWYLALHHTKDSINSPRRLFEAVLEEATDDMRSLFFDDKMAIKLIDDMEMFVEEKYNHMVDLVERFYERNKHLERKDYAILGQAELPRIYFSLAMNKYIDREFSYKDFLKSKWKELGLKDIEKEDNEDK